MKHPSHIYILHIEVATHTDPPGSRWPRGREDGPTFAEMIQQSSCGLLAALDRLRDHGLVQENEGLNTPG